MAPAPSIHFWFVLVWLVIHRTLAHRPGDVRPAHGSREQRWSTILLIAESLALGTVCLIVGWNGRDVPVEAVVVGHAMTAVGVGIVAWSRRILGRHFSIHLQVDEQHSLITEGPYARVRHPIYSGDLLFHAGVPILCGAFEALVFPVIFVCLAVIRLRNEERMLDAAYPGYAAYRERTRALIPGIY